MVWRNHHRAGRGKRERIAALQKRPTITSIETGQFLTENQKRKFRRAAWRARHANNSLGEQDVEVIDLTREPEEIVTSTEIVEDLEPSTVYATTITHLFTKIEQQILTIQHMKENQFSN